MPNLLNRRRFLQSAAAVGAMSAAGPLMGIRPAAAATTVNWLCWGGHVEPKGIKAFNDATGIRVNPIGMNGNAETFAKLKLSGATQYDLFEADGLWPKRYYEEGMIVPIDLEKLPNVAKNMYPEFKKIPDLLTDDGKMLMVPWGWNPTVLVYNKEKVKEVPTSYEVLLDPKYKGHVSFSNQYEFMFPVAAMILGYDKPFDMTDAQLKKATDILVRIKRNAPTITRGWNEQLRLYIEGTIWIGLSSPGRALTVHDSGGPEIGIEPPKEGYFGWIDGDMLVKGAAHPEAALKWINYIHTPEYVAMNFSRLQRGCVNRAGVELLIKEGKQKMVTANLMDQPKMASNMQLIRAPKRPDAYAKAWNEVLAAK